MCSIWETAKIVLPSDCFTGGLAHKIRTYFPIQVVAGVRYRFTLQVGLAISCRKDGKPGTLEQCPVNRDSVSASISGRNVRP